jgi:hypothetical protein
VDRKNLVKAHVMAILMEGWIYQPQGPPDPHIFSNDN